MVYEILGLAAMAGSVVFFYESVAILAQRDYVAGLATVAVGFFVLRAGSELSKLAVLERREQS